MSPRSNPLSSQEYERIYQIIYSVLEGRANTPHVCMFFAIVGFFILTALPQDL
ncbi:DUF2026 domain-containing protein [Pectobacterium versatile]|uniref:DUF2026 family protein n=1 Tax=Pectobacterium versatile TaxID=2488639 RepID=UPI003CD0D44F|nr:DUF2026 domain-containing protein [Pectobacterium versatile]